VGIVLFATSRYNLLSNLLTIYHVICTIILKNYFDLFYAALLSKNTLRIGFLQYITLDRGFFEVSYHIFYTLLNNSLKNKRLVILWLFLVISLIPGYFIVNYTNFISNFDLSTIFFLILDFFELFDPTIVYPLLFLCISFFVLSRSPDNPQKITTDMAGLYFILGGICFMSIEYLLLLKALKGSPKYNDTDLYGRFFIRCWLIIFIILFVIYTICVDLKYITASDFFELVITFGTLVPTYFLSKFWWNKK